MLFIDIYKYCEYRIYFKVQYFIYIFQSEEFSHKKAQHIKNGTALRRAMEIIKKKLFIGAFVHHHLKYTERYIHRENIKIKSKLHFDQRYKQSQVELKEYHT